MEQARQDIRSAGFRATSARIATLLELRSSKMPLTHAELAERLAGGGFDKATAFRNLNDLASVGLLRKTELGGHVWRFEAIDPGQREAADHPHFVCVDCGTVTCMESIDLGASGRAQLASLGDVTELLLRGHCRECQ